MTDNEIIKAVGLCNGIESGRCDECSYRNTKDGDCVEILAKDTIDLINRKNAEIDDLKRDTIPKLQDGLKRANKYGVETDKENQQLKAEIDRLKAYEIMAEGYADALVEMTKAEAYKEFAERLKQKTKQIQITYHLEYDVVFASEIDNLLKEMVGDNNGRTQQADTESANT